MRGRQRSSGPPRSRVYSATSPPSGSRTPHFSGRDLSNVGDLMRRNTSARLSLVATLGIFLPALAIAQQDTPAGVQQASVRNDPASKKILGLADIGRWNRIANTGLSADCQWMTYVYQPNARDSTLYAR